MVGDGPAGAPGCVGAAPAGLVPPAGLRGEVPELPAPGYTWEQEPELNQAIYEKYRDLSLDEVLAFSQASHRETLGVVQGMSEAELFTPGAYAWTKQNTLCAYVDPCTASHYRWAREEILAGRDRQGAQSPE